MTNVGVVGRGKGSCLNENGSNYQNNVNCFSDMVKLEGSSQRWQRRCVDPKRWMFR